MKMRAFVTAAFSLGLAAGAAMAGGVTTITQWTFEGDVLTPSTGSGMARNIGGTSSAFATGAGGGRGWNTSAYPAQFVGSGTAGVEFMVSTESYLDIAVRFDHRASGTASRWAALEYTTNGGASWIRFQQYSNLSPHDTFYAQGPFDLSSIAEVEDNPGFGIRIVSIFSPVAFEDGLGASFGPNQAYHRARADGAGSPYGSAGTWRFDNVTITGTLIPEPASLALLAIGALGLLRRRIG